jgi:predicted Zn-dependent protease
MTRAARAMPQLQGVRRSTARLGRGVLALLLSISIVFHATPASAAGLIRDSEIETLIREYSAPIFEAAGLGTQNINIHLINDRSFNAFVVDGQNMFLHVGTLMRSETPNQVIGVIAHETGHIAGGHLSRLRQAVSQARSTSLMLRLVGLAAMAAGAVAGGGGDMGEAGAAVMLGGESMAQRSVLAYKRAEESAADQAAVSYLNATGQSARGMLKTFAHFAEQGLASLKHVDPYLQSHPMPQQRITQLRDLARSSPYYEKRDPPELQHRHDMMRAKLAGFLESPQTVFNTYPESDQSLPARYARTIAQYRQSGLDSFLPKMNALLAEQPENPYFLELKGQFLFKSGKAGRAVPPLRKATSLAPDEGLIRILLAKALLAQGKDETLDEAINHLRKALVQEDSSATGFRQLANAYGRKGQIAQAELASAQAYLHEGKLELAKQQAERAKTKFKTGTPEWIKADDIVGYEPPTK